jgi:hypothetical protein
MSAARTPCWCSGSLPDPDFAAPICACVIFRCVIHRDDETGVACCTLWSEPEAPEAPDDDEDQGRAPEREHLTC